MRDYDGARACDLEALRRLLPRHAGPRDLPAPRRSSRPGFPRWPTARPSIWTARLKPPARGAARGARVSAAGRGRGGGRARRLATLRPGAAGTGPLRGPGRSGRPALRARGGTTRAISSTTTEREPFAGMDEDLRLLAGDALYALGLARLAERGRPGGRGRAGGPDLASLPAPTRKGGPRSRPRSGRASASALSSAPR